MMSKRFTIAVMLGWMTAVALCCGLGYWLGGMATQRSERLGYCSRYQLIRFENCWYAKTCDCDTWPTAIPWWTKPFVRCEDCGKGFKALTVAEAQAQISEWDAAGVSYGVSGSHTPGIDWWPE